MKPCLIFALMFLCVGTANAELRVIGVRVEKGADAKLRVSISSDEKAEVKKDISVDEAAAVLRHAKGWGSTVVVGIVAHNVPLNDYLPLMKAIAENGWLQLAFVEGMEPGFLFNNIKKSLGERGP